MSTFKIYNQYCRSSFLVRDELSPTTMALMHAFKIQQDVLATAIFKSRFIGSDDNSIPLIIREFMYPFKNHGSNKVLLDDFIASPKPLKVEIDMCIYHLDPHAFSDISDDQLFDDQNIDILIETPGFSNFFRKFLALYSLQGARAKRPSLLSYLDMIKAKKQNDNLVIVPVVFYDDYFEARAEYQKYEEHGIYVVSLLPHLLGADALVASNSLSADQRPIDVFLSGSLLDWLYPYRSISYPIVKGMHGCNVLDDTATYWTCQAQIADIMKRASGLNDLDLIKESTVINSLIEGYYEHYYDQLKKSKLAIVGNNVFGYTARRYFEYMSNGCVCVGQLPKLAEKYGLKHMVHVYECKPNEVEDAIKFLLSNEPIRLKIAENALAWVRQSYTAEHLADGLLGDIDKIIEKRGTIK
jgi:hypothetical protein